MLTCTCDASIIANLLDKLVYSQFQLQNSSVAYRRKNCLIFSVHPNVTTSYLLQELFDTFVDFFAKLDALISNPLNSIPPKRNSFNWAATNLIVHVVIHIHLLLHLSICGYLLNVHFITLLFEILFKQFCKYFI